VKTKRVASKTTPLERVAIVVASFLLSVGLIAVMSGFFQSKDQAGVSGDTGPAIGQQFPDLGHAHLQPGELRPPYNSNPPTSGAHVPLAVLRDASTLSTDQELEALELGDIVIAYGDAQPPKALRDLQQSVAGPFTPALAAAGGAVILWHRPGTNGYIGLAWTRMLHVRTTGDLLKQFAQRYLGQGAPTPKLTKKKQT
jgi:hypothetical protein